MDQQWNHEGVVITADAVRKAFENIRDGEDVIQSCQLVRNVLASSNTSQIDFCVGLNGIEIFLSTMSKSSDPIVQVECARGLTKIASETSGHTQLAIQAGVLPAFLNLQPILMTRPIFFSSVLK